MRTLCRSVGLSAVFATVSFSNTASAQWSVIYLNPTAEAQSGAYGVSGLHQVGQAYVDGVTRASLWSRSASSWVDLHPAGALYSIAFGVHDGQQIGYAEVGGVEHASLWSGTAASRVDLNPAGALKSYGYGVSGGQQVGASKFGNGDVTHAGIWTGTAASWTDLHPEGATYSTAFGVFGGQQAGYANFGGSNSHAGLWNGTAESWTDLHPAGASSSVAWCISATQQAGHALVGGDPHASLWTGTAASWVDLHPAGALLRESYVHGVSGGQQAGQVRVDGAIHASAWSGTAASWVDLHSFLPPDFEWSEARSVWHNGTYTYVVGTAHSISKDQRMAVMWITPSSGCDTAITDQPKPVALIPNSNAVFTIGVSGTGEAYQWRKNGSPLTNGGHVSGVDSSTLSITNVQSSDQGDYNCVVTVPCEPLTSIAAELSCRPIITVQPPPTATLHVGLQIGLSVPTSAPYSFRWRQNGQNLFNTAGLFSGVTTRTLTLLAVDPSLAGTYDCVLTDSCGTTQSDPTQVYCPADFDQDGFISGPDFDLYVAAFEAGDAMADFDGDEFVSGIDFDLFVQSFEAGC